MTIANIPKRLSSVRRVKGKAVKLMRGVGGLDNRMLDVVPLTEQGQVSEMIY